MSESDQSSNPSRPPIEGAPASPPPPPPGYSYPPPPPQKGGSMWGRLFGSALLTLLIFSIGLNLYFGFLIHTMTAGPSEAIYEDGDPDHRIVILPVRGLINDRTQNFVRIALRALRDDPPAAVILRIDSQGGEVGASDRVWDMLDQFKRETDVPVVASLGSIATSGGYYVASGADAIYAEPTSITGSIGVMAPHFEIHALLEKIGVEPEIIISEDSPAKDMFSIARPWTDEDREARRAMLQPIYERFVEVIHQGRSHVLDEQQVRERATGELFTAGAAREQDLIDEVGYLRDVIEHAAEQAEVPGDVTPQVRVMQEPRGFGLGRLLGAGPGVSLEPAEISGEQVRDWVLELAAPRLMYAPQ